MTHRQDVVRGRDILERWCALAEQRLDYLTEMFESGRWRRYHTEAAFLDNIREAKSAVAVWRNLSVREASRDNSAVDISWLGRPRSAPRGEPAVDQADSLQPQYPAMPELPQIAAAPPLSDLSMGGETGPVEAPALPILDIREPGLDVREQELELAHAPAMTLDIALMRERYPLLRNVQL